MLVTDVFHHSDEEIEYWFSSHETYSHVGNITTYNTLHKNENNFTVVHQASTFYGLLKSKLIKLSYSHLDLSCLCDFEQYSIALQLAACL